MSSLFLSSSDDSGNECGGRMYGVASYESKTPQDVRKVHRAKGHQ
jgi:hypothetical protein